LKANQSPPKGTEKLQVSRRPDGNSAVVNGKGARGLDLGEPRLRSRDGIPKVRVLRPTGPQEILNEGVVLAGVKLRREGRDGTEEDADLQDETHGNGAHGGPALRDDAALATRRRQRGEKGVKASARAGNDDTAADRTHRQPRADETNSERSGHHKVGARGVVATARFEQKLDERGRNEEGKKRKMSSSSQISPRSRARKVAGNGSH
jgi:hypothetical protein